MVSEVRTLGELAILVDAYHREVVGWREETKGLIADHETRIRFIEDNKRSNSNGNSRRQKIKEKGPPLATGGGIVAIVVLVFERLSLIPVS